MRESVHLYVIRIAILNLSMHKYDMGKSIMSSEAAMCYFLDS